MSATYDVSTAIGKVRLRIPDRNVSSALFQDDEIQVFLEANGQNVLLAAAEAIETVAGDPQRLQSISRGSVSEQKQLASDLRERAKGLRLMANRESGSILAGEFERGDFYDGSDEILG